MLHPALTRALATAHIEDLRRAAARRHTIRLARRTAHEPHPAATPIAILRSASTRLRGRRVPQADRTIHGAPLGSGGGTPAMCRHEDAGVVARTGSYTNSFTSQWSANGSSLNGCTSTQPVER